MTAKSTAKPTVKPHVFGYGSLVNLTTHSLGEPRTGTLHGWRRGWYDTAARPLAFLTAVRDDSSSIEGIIAHVPGGDWQALDAREAGYDRVAQTGICVRVGPLELAVYAIPPRARIETAPRRPILLSYLDVVVQGYLHQFGPEGVARFFATTDGWDAPVLDDHSAPRYPRHRRLSSRETALVDDHLAALGATRV
ncbi:gamma-glutamylcyclotransferase family protein [Pontibaca methylaminivorans]|uniref:glutathione-specific gamma-glutamylcyclotransferase n=1 Tax=Pontibaca methylaminivorans TaxID=515897 RepID=A0A1R3WXM0_9RHOB|nr:gamma-glutamylcyclotransferase family protein [Pontibaca methylaminivorans]SIT83009.1 ChaC-like protein [Pontibaca methylaminivorans]